MTDTATLRILQYNIRNELGIITALLADSAIQSTDVLAIQEPSFNSHTGSSYNLGTSQFYLAHRSGKDTRVCFYINKRLNPENWDVEFVTKDISTLKIRPRQGEEVNRIERLSIHNIYNPSPSLSSAENPSSLPQILGLVQEPGEYLLLGDFNLHHPSWNNPGRFSYYREANDLIAATVERGMALILPKGVVT